MNPTQKMIKRLFLSIAISVAAIIAGTSSAAAQSEACIHNGAMAFTRIAVLAAGEAVVGCCEVHPGGTQCVSLEFIPDGTRFAVSALFLGSSGQFEVECGGNFNTLTRSASLQTSISFNVSGSLFDPHCTAPTGALDPKPK
jgi:hypothetical protein